MTFVTLALLLNTVIYTENLATRQSQQSGVPIEWTAEGIDATAGSIESVNHQATPTVTNLTKQLDSWTQLANRQASASGATVSLQLLSTTDGTHIQQTNSTRNLTAGGTATGAESWTLVSDTSGIRSFSITPNQDSLADAPLDGSALDLTGNILTTGFNVTVTNGTENWRMYVVKNATDVIVFTEYPDGELDSLSNLDNYCSTSESSPRIDITNESLAGEQCDQLAFPPAMTGPLTVRYGNADQATGNYSLFINDTGATVPSSNYNTEPNSPFVRDGVYSARVQVGYTESSIAYTRNGTAIPGQALRP